MNQRFIKLLLLLLISAAALPKSQSAIAAVPLAGELGFRESSLPVMGDFDHDRKMDRATLSSFGSLKSVRISYGKASSSTYTFFTRIVEAGNLYSLDVDSDGDTDLVWIAREAPLDYAVLITDSVGEFHFGTRSRISPCQLESLLRPRSTFFSPFPAKDASTISELSSSEPSLPAATAEYLAPTPTVPQHFIGIVPHLISTVGLLPKRGPPSLPA